ncbi:hypothetical protein JMJ55_28005 [Belnapia sp. T6]|uniref:Uncharacterized protein n=1 Tax=Belnapia mucosa TaxID=2804532 RepID=A0ABS1VDG2_9PROT|nr:hypothetical protein [Belnapia mucosa]MBL6459171.1 hypothetical protein [Belnapia mucosa]
MDRFIIAGDFAGAAALILADYRGFVARYAEEPEDAVTKAFSARHTAGRTALAHLEQLVKLAAEAGDEAQRKAVGEVLAEWRRLMPPMQEEEDAAGGGG